MWYSIRKINNNTIEVCNTHIDTINVSVRYVNNCANTELEYDSIKLDLETSAQFTVFNKGEGIYKIDIESEDNIVSYVLPYYPEVLEGLVKDIKNVLCEGKEICQTCNKDYNTNSLQTDKEKEESKICEVLNKAFLYYLLVGKYYQPYFNALTENLDCDIKKEFSCLKMQEFITGKSNNSIFNKRLISQLYLTFYYAHKDLEKDFRDIDLLFEYETIKNCLVGVSSIFIDNLEHNRVGIYEIGSRSFEIQKDSVYTFTQKDFKDKLIPNYYTSIMDSIEFIKIGRINEGYKSSFKFKNEPLQEGQVILFEDIAKGTLKYYGPPNSVVYKHYSHFTFSIKTKMGNRFSKLSKIEMIS